MNGRVPQAGDGERIVPRSIAAIEAADIGANTVCSFGDVEAGGPWRRCPGPSGASSTHGHDACTTDEQPQQQEQVSPPLSSVPAPRVTAYPDWGRRSAAMSRSRASMN